jgi:Ulp1 family protease
LKEIPNEVYIFDPSFCSQMVDEIDMKRYVEHLRLADKTFLLMPAHLLGNHWTLLLFDVPNRKTYFLNSKIGDCYLDPAKMINNLFWPLIIGEEELGVEFNISKVQQQPNLNDCAVYVIQFCLELLKFFRTSTILNIGSVLSQSMFTSITYDLILDLRWIIIKKYSDVEKNVKSDIELKRLEFREFINNDTSKQQDQFVENNEGIIKQVEDVDVETKKKTITNALEFSSSPLTELEEDALNPIDESTSVETEEPEPVEGMNING